MKSVQYILEQMPAHKFDGNSSVSIERVVELGMVSQHKNSLSWCNAKNIPLLQEVTSGTVICPVLPSSFKMNASVNYIQVDSPRQYFMGVLKLLFPQTPTAGIAASARIHPSVRIGKNVYVGENVVVEENCVLSDGCVIGHNTVIYRNTRIGINVQIGANNTIGAPGFGYEQN